MGLLHARRSEPGPRSRRASVRRQPGRAGLVSRGRVRHGPDPPDLYRSRRAFPLLPHYQYCRNDGARTDPDLRRGPCRGRSEQQSICSSHGRDRWQSGSRTSSGPGSGLRPVSIWLDARRRTWNRDRSIRLPPTGSGSCCHPCPGVTTAWSFRRSTRTRTVPEETQSRISLMIWSSSDH